MVVNKLNASSQAATATMETLRELLKPHLGLPKARLNCFLMLVLAVSGQRTVTAVEMVVAVVGGVAGGLLRADVVGPDRDAGMPGSLGDQAAAREEIDKGWKVCVQGFF